MTALSRRRFVSRLISTASACALPLSARCRRASGDEPVIDVHIHANFNDATLRSQAQTASGVDYSPEGLRREMEENNIRHALSIGFASEDSQLSHEAPNPMGAGTTATVLEDIVSWIGGINPYRLDQTSLRRIEETLEAGRLKGLKIYLGYYPLPPNAEEYRPVYELAARYRIPVIFHTGDTYSADARVRFAHPLPIDDVAVEFRQVTFVLAHLGNPWTMDAAEVLYKNENVYGDLSGFFVGDRDYFTDPENAEGIDHAIDRIRRAFAWVENPKKFMFGTDWPLVPIQPYLKLMRRAIPPRHHGDVFYSNAVSVFGLG